MITSIYLCVVVLVWNVIMIMMGMDKSDHFLYDVRRYMRDRQRNKEEQKRKKQLELEAQKKKEEPVVINTVDKGDEYRIQTQISLNEIDDTIYDDINGEFNVNINLGNDNIIILDRQFNINSYVSDIKKQIKIQINYDNEWKYLHLRTLNNDILKDNYKLGSYNIIDSKNLLFLSYQVKSTQN